MPRPPTPLSGVRTLPPFPVEVLPDWIAAQVRNVSEAICMTSDLAAVFALSVISVGAGHRVSVSPRPGHIEPVNLYTLGVLDSGEGKSPVVDRMVEPVYRVEEELARGTRAEIAGALVRKELAEQRAAEAKKKAIRADGIDAVAATQEAERLALAAENISVPATPVLLADDITPEALASLTAAQGGRMAFLSDEGGMFENLGRYVSKAESGAIPDIYLKGHNGGQVRVHRVASGRNTQPQRAYLTIGLATQPRSLEQLGANAAAVGRGFMARFLTYVPTSMVGHRNWLSAPAVDEEIAAEYVRRMSSLLRTFLVEDPVSHDVERFRLSLTPEGTRRWLEFRQDLEPLLDEDGALRGMKDWANKLAGHVLRLAGLLHIAHTEGRDLVGPISLKTLQEAMAIGRWLIPHAVVAYEQLAPSNRKQLAARILRTVKKYFQPDTVWTKKQLFDRIRSSAVEEASQLDDPLQLLLEYGWVKEIPYADADPHRRGRKRSPQYMAHPCLWDNLAPQRDLLNALDSGEAA